MKILQLLVRRFCSYEIFLFLFFRGLCATAPAEEFKQLTWVTVSGRLEVQSFQEEGNGPVGAWVINLASPIDIAADPTNPINPKPILHIQVVQLAGFEPAFRSVLKRYEGKVVTVSGRFFAAHTRHHYTQAVFELAPATQQQMQSL